LIPNEGVRRRIDVLNVDRLAYDVVRASRGAPVIADERMLRAGRGRPVGQAQRGQVWQAAQRVTGELAALRQSTHLPLANEAAHLLRREEAPALPARPGGRCPGPAPVPVAAAPRCTLFVACTRARDHLSVSGAGELSPFLPAPLAVTPGGEACAGRCGFR